MLVGLPHPRQTHRQKAYSECARLVPYQTTDMVPCVVELHDADYTLITDGQLSNMCAALHTYLITAANIFACKRVEAWRPHRTKATVVTTENATEKATSAQ